MDSAARDSAQSITSNRKTAEGRIAPPINVSRIVKRFYNGMDAEGAYATPTGER